MKKLLLILSILMFVVSCKRDNDSEPNGMYEEKTPIKKRTKMDFDADNNKVTIFYEDGTQKDFYFTVSEEFSGMTLTPINTATYPAENLYYSYKDPDTFFLGNIYNTETTDMEFGRPSDKEE